jgi:hypothetical protein
MGDVSINVKVDLNKIEKQFGTFNITRARYAMANQALIDMNKLVPRRQGKLRASGHAAQDGSSVSWTTIYARAQFYGMVGRAPGHRVRKYTTPGTNRRWDLIGKARYMSQWQATLKKGLQL